MPSPEMVRRGEYAARGDYHRTLDPSWDYYPTYIAKLEAVRRYLNALPSSSRVLDAGCGEGVLVEEYAGRLDITGVDANYSSARVTTGSVTALPFPDASFDRALCLDVLEHLAVRGAAPRAGRALPRPPAGRRAAGLGAEPGAPAVAHPVPAARPVDPDRVGIQTPGGSSRRRVPPARAPRRLLARRPPWHLPDRAGPHAPRAPPPAGARAAPPRADPAAARARAGAS